MHMNQLLCRNTSFESYLQTLRAAWKAPAFAASFLCGSFLRPPTAVVGLQSVSVFIYGHKRICHVRCRKTWWASKSSMSCLHGWCICTLQVFLSIQLQWYFHVLNAYIHNNTHTHTHSMYTDIFTWKRHFYPGVQSFHIVHACMFTSTCCGLVKNQKNMKQASARAHDFSVSFTSCTHNFKLRVHVDTSMI